MNTNKKNYSIIRDENTTKDKIEKEFNPSKKAVAIRYEPEESNVPTVLAKGKGIIAENIVKNAVIEDIPILEDEKLVKELVNVEIGQEIPPELYQVVAEILVFVNDLDELEGRVHGDKQKKNW